MNLFSLEGKVAIITGAGSGIGKAIAEVFSKQGAILCILDFNEEAGKAACESIGDRTYFYKCNVTDQGQVGEIVETIEKRFGKIDILVNSAGIAQVGNLENTSESDFEKIFQVNVKGTYNVMHKVISFMKENKKGVILNLASVAASLGIADRFAYSMSKGAMASMTLSVAKDYLKDGIRCNSISPARVHTPFVDGFIKANYPGTETEMFEKLSRTQPIGRMARPEEIAWLALYLCSDEAGFVTGCDYPIDGGFMHLNT